MAKLTKDQALDGLQKLHALTREKSSMTRNELQEASGLRLTDMIVLSENKIISCTSRRPACWEWTQDVVPNIEMAERMLKTKVKVWYNRPTRNSILYTPGEEAPTVTASPTPVKSRIPGVRVFKKFEITKKYGDHTFTITLEESNGGWKHALADNIVTGSCSADKLRAIGFALITAADIIDKESDK